MTNIDLNTWTQSPSKPKTLIEQDDKHRSLNKMTNHVVLKTSSDVAPVTNKISKVHLRSISNTYFEV